MAEKNFCFFLGKHPQKILDIEKDNSKISPPSVSVGNKQPKET